MGADTMTQLVAAAFYLLKACVGVALLALVLITVTRLIMTVAKTAWKG